jgi:hypothetical protein
LNPDTDAIAELSNKAWYSYLATNDRYSERREDKSKRPKEKDRKNE